MDWYCKFHSSPYGCLHSEGSIRLLRDQFNAFTSCKMNINMTFSTSSKWDKAAILLPYFDRARRYIKEINHVSTTDTFVHYNYWTGLSTGYNVICQSVEWDIRGSCHLITHCSYSMEHLICCNSLFGCESAENLPKPTCAWQASTNYYSKGWWTKCGVSDSPESTFMVRCGCYPIVVKLQMNITLYPYQGWMHDTYWY